MSLRDDDLDFIDDGSDVENVPKAKKKRAKPEAGAKTAASKPKKAKPPPPPTETTVDENGWTLDPPGLMYKNFGSTPSAKIAGVDLDGTLVRTKTGADFATSATDWKFASSSVQATLQQLHSDGFRIVVFSNQGGVKKALNGAAAATAKGKVDAMMAKLGVPALVLMATLKDSLRKPETGMWERMVSMNGGVAPDKAVSFFCGDAAGRPDDFKDSETKAPSTADKDFASNIGVPFKEPEQLFPSDGNDGGVNDTIIAVFNELADYFKTSGGDKDHFKASAFRKVSAALCDFEPEITESNLKEVGKLKGVGKGSLGIISEYVKTGKVEELEKIRSMKGEQTAAPAAKQGPAPPKNAAAAEALKFM